MDESKPKTKKSKKGSAALAMPNFFSSIPFHKVSFNSMTSGCEKTL